MAINGGSNTILKYFGGGVNVFDSENTIGDSQAVTQHNIVCGEGYFKTVEGDSLEYSALDNFLDIQNTGTWGDDDVISDDSNLLIKEGSSFVRVFDLSGSDFIENSRFLSYNDDLYCCTTIGILRLVRDKNVETVFPGATQIKIYNISKFPESGSILRGTEIITYTGKSGDYLTGVSGVVSSISVNENIVAKGDTEVDLHDAEYFFKTTGETSDNVNRGYPQTNWKPQYPIDTTYYNDVSITTESEQFPDGGVQIYSADPKARASIEVDVITGKEHTFSFSAKEITTGDDWKALVYYDGVAISAATVDFDANGDYEVVFTVPADDLKKTGTARLVITNITQYVGIYGVFGNFKYVCETGFYDGFIPTILEEYGNKMWAAGFEKTFAWKDNQFRVYYSVTATKDQPDNFYNFISLGSGFEYIADNTSPSAMIRFKNNLIISTKDEVRMVTGFNSETIPAPIFERFFKEGGAIHQNAMIATEDEIFFFTEEKKLKRLFEAEGFKGVKPDYEFDNNISEYLSDIQDNDMDRVILTYDRFKNILTLFNGDTTTTAIAYDVKKKYFFTFETIVRPDAAFYSVDDRVVYYGRSDDLYTLFTDSRIDECDRRSKSFDFDDPTGMKLFLFFGIGGEIDLGSGDTVYCDIIIKTDGNDEIISKAITNADVDSTGDEFYVRFDIGVIGKELQFRVYSTDASASNISFLINKVDIEQKRLGSRHQEPTQ